MVVVNYHIPTKIKGKTSKSGEGQLFIPWFAAIKAKNTSTFMREKQLLPASACTRMIYWQYQVLVRADIKMAPDPIVVLPIQMLPCLYPELRCNNLHVSIGEAQQPYNLKLEVIEGRNLVPKDLGGLSDPYCIIKYQSGIRRKEFKTEVIKQNLFPVWNEEFEWAVDLSDRSGGFLLECYDWDLIGEHDEIGQHFVYFGPLLDQYPNETIDVWLGLQPSALTNTKQSGEIHVRLHFSPLSSLTASMAECQEIQHLRRKAGE